MIDLVSSRCANCLFKYSFSFHIQLARRLRFAAARIFMRELV